MKSAWEEIPFADAVRDETGGNFKTLQSDYLVKGDFPVVDQGKEAIAGYTNDPNRLCKADVPCIVFGDHTRTIKFVDFPFCIGADGTKVLRPREGIDALYLFHFLRSISIPSAGYSRHFKFLKKTQVRRPPLEEQKRIAAILDKADLLRRQCQSALDRLDQLGQSIFYEMFGDVRQNSEGFEEQELGSFTEIKLGKMLDKKRFSGARKRKYLRNANVRWFNFDLSEIYEMEFHSHELARFQVLPGDLLICEGGEPGRCAIWEKQDCEIYYQKALHRLRITQKKALPEYISFWLFLSSKHRLFGDVITAATIAHLTGEKIKRLKIPLPPIDLQVSFVDRQRKVSKVREVLEEKFHQLNSLFHSLQQRAFRGEL